LRFAVHRPAQRQASPRSHRPPDGDVLGRVHIRVPRMPAGPATEDGLALARLRVHDPARRATLTRVRGVDPLNPMRRLVFQAGHQPAPTGPMDGPVEPRLLPHLAARRLHRAACATNHVGNLQILDADHVETAGEIGGGLLDPVLTPVPLARLESRDRDLGSSPSCRPWSRAGESSLETQKPLGLVFAQAWSEQQLASRQRGRYGDTTIDTNDFSCSGPADRCGNHGEGNVSSPRPVSGDSIRLRQIGNSARPSEPNPADFWDLHLAGIPRYASDIPMDTAFADDAKPFVLARFTPFWTPLGPVEVAGHCLSEVSQCLLLHDRRSCAQPREFRPRLGQLAGLFDETRCRLPARSPVPMLLNREIPDEPRVRAVFQQCLLLVGRWLKSKAGHVNTLLAATDIANEQSPRHRSEAFVDALPG